MFVGEQDGVPERELKDRFSEFITAAGVHCRAYLARVEYGSLQGLNVALCVSVQSGDIQVIKSGVARIFREMFRTNEHLDVIVLSESQEHELKAVASRFFPNSMDARK